ncbi:uncharacterized protein LOC108286207 [Cebus imitator]|uniref:uncharacterized protein LOC108286207 n=1 Tax=Cebus imitator TaxID=2715852 RepID=UPI00189C3930|nr:uncharacterized protein LOC108286207 [Cebus imitator]
MSPKEAAGTQGPREILWGQRPVSILGDLVDSAGWEGEARSSLVRRAQGAPRPPTFLSAPRPGPAGASVSPGTSPRLHRRPPPSSGLEGGCVFRLPENVYFRLFRSPSHVLCACSRRAAELPRAPREADAEASGWVEQPSQLPSPAAQRSGLETAQPATARAATALRRRTKAEPPHCPVTVKPRRPAGAHLSHSSSESQLLARASFLEAEIQVSA